MNLLNTTLKNSVQVIIRFAISILNIKIVAVLVGPSGMALVSQLNNTLQVGVSLASLGFREGIVKYISEHKGDKQKQSEFISTSIIAVLGSSAFLGLIAMLFSRALSSYILNTEEFYQLFRLSGIYLVTTSLLNLLLSFLNGLEKQKQFIILNIILSVSGFLIALGAVLLWGLDGLVWAQIFLTIIAFVCGIFIYKSAIKVDIKSFSPQVIKKLGKYSAMTLFSAVIAPMLAIAIRKTIETETSMEVAGLWDGINKISNNYFLIITSAFSYYFIPTFSQLTKHRDIVNEIKKAYKLLAPLLLIGGLGIFFTKDLIIKMLFTNEFEGMRPLFIWQVIGDFFKILTWIIAMLFIAKARIKTYITTELISIGLQIILVKIIIAHLGDEYINLYYAIENCLFFFIMATIFYFYYIKERSKV